ncbi:hypothetical protein AcetOrient_orf02418 [Acetobacter orientalis]|uniref:Uncharacterized protein n=1 Tax=Acetobacter orientalis TaxID=146474 RepID=A0A2Z5ZH80_9PROT|nr:hypothetical protein AcetOrient_orf02418 [Acetobacter orientalis]
MAEPWWLMIAAMRKFWRPDCAGCPLLVGLGVLSMAGFYWL